MKKWESWLLGFIDPDFMQETPTVFRQISTGTPKNRSWFMGGRLFQDSISSILINIMAYTPLLYCSKYNFLKSTVSKIRWRDFTKWMMKIMTWPTMKFSLIQKLMANKPILETTFCKRLFFQRYSVSIWLPKPIFPNPVPGGAPTFWISPLSDPSISGLMSLH